MPFTPTPQDLLDLLHYNAETGRLYWKDRPLRFFVTEKQTPELSRKKWNIRLKGKEAFTATDAGGYRVGMLFGKRYSAHRIIWAMVHGEWPSTLVDHVNGDPADNKISNLRLATSSQNNKNKKKSKANKSGVIGVHWSNVTKKWHAQITVDWQHKFLGAFDNFEQAVAARKAAEFANNFHPNHGR